MSITTAYSFCGASGYPYAYQHPQNLSAIPAEPGNYMFAFWQKNQWRVLYVGESGNLQNRIVNNRHEKLGSCKSFASPDNVHILYHANGWAENIRKFAEKDIIAIYKPPFNR